MYSKGTITVNVGRRMLDKEELTQIKQLIEEESGVTVSRFWCSPNVLEEALSENMGFGVAVSPKEERIRKEPIREEIAHNDPRFFQNPGSVESDGPEGPEFWAPYILDLPERVEYVGHSTSEDPRLIASQLLDVPLHNTVPQEVVLEDIVATPEAANAQTDEIFGAQGMDEDSPTGDLITVDLVSVEPGSLADPASEDDQNEPPPSNNSIEGATSVAAIETEAEVGKAEVSPVKRFDAAREVSGLNRGNEALLIKTHCRSGEIIRYPGDVVVMADVNPGSEIIADGDILVFGSLRGFAHAGANGDIQATIVAQNFETPRLQIGPYVGVDPKPKKRTKSKSSNPRIAYVRRRSVYVAPYTGRFGGYSGGILYDG
jgi:septum formation inhibitor MinC